MNSIQFARITSFLLLGMLRCPLLADEGPQQGDSFAHQIKVDDQQFAVFFQDSTLTGAEKAAIVADYQNLLKVLASHERRTFSNPKSIGTGENGVRVIGAFSYSERYVKRPDEVEHEIGLIGKSLDDQECLVIRTKLSDGYRAAMALKKAHEEACRTLSQFIAMLNNMTEAEMPAVKDLFYVPGATKEDIEKEAENANKHKIFEDCRQLRYTWTSILELRKFDGKFATLVYTTNKDNGQLIEMLAIYDDGRWKLAILRPGT